MAGHNHKGRSKSVPPFVMVTQHEFDCAAYRALSPVCRAVYWELIRRYDGFNNGRIGLSVRDAAKECKINKDTATKAFGTLVEMGFVECVTRGGFSRKVRHAAEWRLTGRRSDISGERPSREFLLWRPDRDKSKTRSETSSTPVP